MRFSKHLNANHAAPRHGVTLIEVMMSTMVVSLGILGLVALVPLGTHLTERGTRADRIAIIGERAFHEARIRGYLDPSRWVDPSTTSTISWVQTAGDFPLPLRQPYMIDPMFFIPDNSANPPIFDPSRRYFPYAKQFTYGKDMGPQVLQHANAGTNKPVRMLRLSVNPQPESSDHLSIPEARMAFEAEDDLSFERPSDGEAPPVQSFYLRDQTNITSSNNHNTGGVSTNVGGEIRRQANGEYTWMIMLTPEPLDLYRVSAFPPTSPPLPPTLSASQATLMHPPITNPGGGGFTDNMRDTLNAAATNEYVASILILKNRQGTIPTGAVPDPITPTTDPEEWQTNERILEVEPASFVGTSGGATGEVQIQQTGGTREDAEERILKARNGDWICLVRRMPSYDYSPIGSGTNTRRLPRGDVYLWYKIVMVDEIEDANGSTTGDVAPFTRRLTLSGPDWPVDNSASPEPIQPTHAIMVEGVVGVYTRNVRLQSQNTWTP